MTSLRQFDNEDWSGRSQSAYFRNYRTAAVSSHTAAVERMACGAALQNRDQERDSTEMHQRVNHHQGIGVISQEARVFPAQVLLQTTENIRGILFPHSTHDGLKCIADLNEQG